MFIQYNISDGDIVNIQATNNKRGCDITLSALGRGQYEVADNINIFSTVNVKTGEIIAPIEKDNDTPVLTDEGYIQPFLGESTPKMVKL